MKNFCLNVIISIALLFTLPQVKAQDAMSKKEQRRIKKEQAFTKLKPMLEDLNFNFQATKANPQSGRQVDLTTHSTTFKIINDSLYVDLPFFGRAYNTPYGGSGGIKCSGHYTNYELKTNEKQLSYILKFKCKGENETYEFSLIVSHSGSATLNVIASQRASISYYGQIEQNKIKE